MYDIHETTYFQQEPPDRPVMGMIADYDVSQPYELDAAAVFKCEGRGYLVVIVSSCSCWPDMGSTHQEYCQNRAAVDNVLRGEWAGLLDLCQQKNWKVRND